MKIRFAFAVAIVIMGSITSFYHIENALACFSILPLLMIDSNELTRPIPRKEWLITINSLIVFFIIAYAVIYYTSPRIKQVVNHIINHPIFIICWSGFWLCAIYRAWQRHKQPTAS